VVGEKSFVGGEFSYSKAELQNKEDTFLWLGVVLLTA
jgi:hypothetical protein